MSGMLAKAVNGFDPDLETLLLSRQTVDLEYCRNRREYLVNHSVVLSERRRLHIHDVSGLQIKFAGQ